MSAFADKIKQAAGAAGRLNSKFTARADAIIAKEALLDQQGDAAFNLHDQWLADAEAGLHDVQAALAPVTNGGPPLEDSSHTSTPDGHIIVVDGRVSGS